VKLKAIIHDAGEGGYWAEVPALPGCMTEGESLEESEANLREAIAGWIEAGEETDAGAEGTVLELAA